MRVTYRKNCRRKHLLVRGNVLSVNNKGEWSKVTYCKYCNDAELISNYIATHKTSLRRLSKEERLLNAIFGKSEENKGRYFKK